MVIGYFLVLFAIDLGKIAVVTFILSMQGPTFRRKRSFLIFLVVANASKSLLFRTVTKNL